jgi:hypothetical protein
MADGFSKKMNIEDALEQFAHLQTPVGESRGGLARYGAAMYFYQYDLITPELLEIYRICSKLDKDSPLEVAKHQSIEPHHITLQQLKAV